MITSSVSTVTRLLFPAVQKNADFTDGHAAEMADAVVELAEAVCLAESKRVW